ncbi:MAG TPA: hypothetical protein VH682_11200 [Gemmataceae bacterium]
MEAWKSLPPGPALPKTRDFHTPIQSTLCRLQKGLVECAANFANVARVAKNHSQVVEIDFAQIANVIFHLLVGRALDYTGVLLDLLPQLPGVIDETFRQDREPLRRSVRMLGAEACQSRVNLI